MAAMRVFVAIDISDEARLAAVEYIQRLRLDFPRVNISWEKPEKLHFTIRFLGDIDKGQIGAVLQLTEVVAARFTPFEVHITEGGIFPHPRNPRILWLGVPQKESVTIGRVNADIEAELQAAGFPAEKRKFHPHVTIGRVPDKVNARELVRTHTQRQLQPILFTATGVTVYESKLQKTGSAYLPIRLFPFR
jgi:2'-5' RNA ligase